MGKKILKWAAIILGVIIGIIVIASVAVFFISQGKNNQSYEIEVADLTIPTDAASIEEGERLVAIRGCADCHEANLGGQLFVDDAAFGKFYATNITPGEGSAVASYTAGDWDRAIRHGVNQDGKPILVMPSTDYYRISDEDLAMMIAYLQSLEAVDQSWPDSSPGPLARVLLASGQFKNAAEAIDHDIPAPVSVVREVSAAYGEYLATTCTGCHGVDFSGGAMVGASPDDPPPANLTPAGNLANWSQEDFINTMRTGRTPEGKNLDPDYMPWPITNRMTEDELAAIWLYLSALPAIES